MSDETEGERRRRQMYGPALQPYGDPIFIGGIAGTGKTRLGSLLGRHPRIAVTRRTYLWRKFFGRYGDLSVPRNLDRCLEAVVASPGVKPLRIDSNEIRAELEGRPPSYAEVFAGVHRLNARRAGKSRWCDQLGLVEAYADPIFAAFPTAAMIHIVCDPPCSHLADRGPGRVGWMVGKWATSVNLAQRNTERYGSRYLVIRHEDFRADEESTLRSVCTFLGEPFDLAMMPGTTASAEVRSSRLSTSSSGRRFVETTVSHLMARQGYGPDGASKPVGLRYSLVDRPANRIGLAAWQLVKARSITRQTAGRT